MERRLCTSGGHFRNVAGAVKSGCGNGGIEGDYFG